MSNGTTVTRYWHCLGDEETWFRFDIGRRAEDRAEEIAARFTDTPQARAFLTRSLLMVNKEGLGRTMPQAFGWVPDRQVGEIVMFGFVAGIEFRSAAEATPEAYIAQKPSRFAAASDLKVLTCDTDIVQCPAGPTACVYTVQRQRRTTDLVLVAETVTFPQVEGLNEGAVITMFTHHPDDEDIAAKVGRYGRMIANSLAVEIRRADGTTFTVGPWGEGD